MATLKDIAERCGISTMAVSKILNGRNQGKWASSRLRAEKVRAVAEELDYRPNSAARAMKARSSRQIGAVLLNTGDHKLHYMAGYEFVAGINEYLQNDDYLLTIVRLSDFGNDLDRHRFFKERLFDGIIGIGIQEDEAFMGRLEKNAGVCVWLDSNMWRDVNCIRRDEVHAGFTAAKHLLDAGCKTIYWRHWAYRHFSALERYEGIRKALDTASDVESVEMSGAYENLFSSLSEKARGRIRERRIGVVCGDPLSAQQTLLDGMKHGLRPGMDYSLISCDEVSDNEYIWKGLARVGHWRYDYGKLAADMALKLLSGEKCPSIKLRGSFRGGETIVRTT